MSVFACDVQTRNCACVSSARPDPGGVCCVSSLSDGVRQSAACSVQGDRRTVYVKRSEVLEGELRGRLPRVSVAVPTLSVSYLCYLLSGAEGQIGHSHTHSDLRSPVTRVSPLSETSDDMQSGQTHQPDGPKPEALGLLGSSL